MSPRRNRTLKSDTLAIVRIKISLDLYVETMLNIEKLWLKAELVVGKTGYCGLPLLCVVPLLHLDIFLFPALSFTPLPLSLSSEESPSVLYYFVLSWAVFLYPRDTGIPGTVILWLFHPILLEFQIMPSEREICLRKRPYPWDPETPSERQLSTLALQ